MAEINYALFLFLMASIPTVIGSLILWLQAKRADASDRVMTEIHDSVSTLMVRVSAKIDLLETTNAELRAAIAGMLAAVGPAQQAAADLIGRDELRKPHGREDTDGATTLT